MKIVIATDAWRPQVNGVVRTLEQMTAAATLAGRQFEFVTPQGFATLPLADLSRNTARAGDDQGGRPAHRGCGRRPRPYRDGRADRLGRAQPLPDDGRLFTTSYHTRFPEYIYARARLPEAVDLRGATRLSCALGRA